MSTDIIDPSYNWKQAATQEGVDYGAVQKSFMDQSYGVVANKAKILFQDPFRLGFEIVHRNEKATKMVGIFAFRVNSNLLYAPTFFVNGEIKSADMLYRADVKRFVPLTEEWCAYLVRGVQETSGKPVDKNRPRQADAYMDRLAYPQRVKYASEMDWDAEEWHAENVRLFGEDFDNRLEEMESASAEFAKAASDGSLFKELMLRCADNTPVKRILPDVINEGGPEALEKLAEFLGDSDEASRYLAANYSREELETVDAWMAKEAKPSGPQPAIVLNMDPNMAKSASARERIFDKGYELVDKRPAEMINTVVEEVGDGTIKELSAPGKVKVFLDSGDLVEAILLRHDYDLLEGHNDMPVSTDDGETSDSYSRLPTYVYFPDGKEILELTRGTSVFGDELIDQDTKAHMISAADLKKGKHYVGVSCETETASSPFKVGGTSKDGDSLRIETISNWGNSGEILYAPDRAAEAKGKYISDETMFLEVNVEVEKGESFGGTARSDRFELVCKKAPMNGAQVDQWLRSAGGLTTSNDVTVKSNGDLTFDVEHRAEGTLLKSASNLGMLEAHLQIAEDFNLTTDQAGEILDKAIDNDVTYRVFDSMSKVAFLTRPEGMESWIESYDPELQVKLDAPQEQILSTFTPERSKQQGRYGDTYQRVPAENSKSGSALPMQVIMHEAPEQLAAMSDAYDMPHIFDHGCVSRMAQTSHNIVDQIKKYIPDLETGVDRYFRILFLLRYRPADFEEIYGKDDLVEFEDELSELAGRAGEQLLKVLQQFDPNQYSAQEN